MESNPTPFLSKSSSEDYYMSTTTNDDHKYEYNPYLFQFNLELIQQRFTKYRLQQRINSFAFCIIGLFYLATGWIVIQWRGINGSMGFLWMCQSNACVICIFVCYPLIYVAEYRRRWMDIICEILFPTANIRQSVSDFRVKIISLLVICHAISHWALVGRSLKLCSPSEMQNSFDLCYCNSSETDIPYENFFSMIVLNVAYHYTFLHVLPWAIPVSAYGIGMIWTLTTIAHKRIHMDAIGLNQQQKNFHIVLVLGQLTIFVAHYVMHNYAISCFITQDRAEGVFLMKSSSDVSPRSRNHANHPVAKDDDDDDDVDVDDAMTDISTVSSMTFRSKHAKNQERARIGHAQQHNRISLDNQKRIISKPLLQAGIVTERPLSEVDDYDFDMNLSFANTVHTPPSLS